MNFISWLMGGWARSSSPENRLRTGDVYAGLSLFSSQGEWPELFRYLEEDLELPDEKLRVLILNLVSQLSKLESGVSNPRNPAPEILKQEVAKEVFSAFDALWHTCQRLHMVAQQGINFQSLRAELEDERQGLEQLSEATEDASVELAKLTLSAGQQQVVTAGQKFARLGWAAQELRKIDRQLDG